MVLTSGFVKIGAALSAVALHGFLIWAFLPSSQPVEIAGGGANVAVQLGNSFADLSEGTLTATPTKAQADRPDVAQAAPPLPPLNAAQHPPVAMDTFAPAPDLAKTNTAPVTQSVTPDRVTAAPAPERAELAPLAPAPRPQAARTGATAPAPATYPKVDAPEPQVAQAAPPAVSAAMAPARAMAPAPAPMAGSITANQSGNPNKAERPSPPVATEPPVSTEPAVSPKGSELITAQTPETADPHASLRPKIRPPGFEQVAPPAPNRPKKTATTQTPRGTAKTTTRAGAAQATGTNRAASTATPARKQAVKPGNAAAANYPGKVMARLRRAGTLKTGVKGKVRVQFTIAANGRLAAARVTRSSGSGKLDNAALRVIRRAAPFPKPPAGAQRTFSLTLQGV
ncbi:TonB family protein [Marinovum sp. 2_MG-2023]|uniref:TonB family protein n=1 Tax=unclassified Marinovum TaxID=2647166 RepID=UPI0026E30364|nr:MULTISPECIES: TonB family protein [unclassified Marinovum]MDO6728808.1 TonB family protein [Marinovum sp. 2_MG-2023]MDO6777776.1 TonB family protein [Marinovum sp. 1_MG-2023]